MATNVQVSGTDKIFQELKSRNAEHRAAAAMELRRYVSRIGLACERGLIAT